MLSSHTYLNLDGFQNPHTPLALNHSLYMPYAGQRVATDSILIPTGDILGNEKGRFFDFWSRLKQIGTDLASPAALGACGFDCTGYDTCFPLNRDAQLGSYDWKQEPVATLVSPWSGIQLDLYTDQQALQVYSCTNMNGIKASPASARTSTDTVA
jgi:aldose 1-epimerase